MADKLIQIINGKVVATTITKQMRKEWTAQTESMIEKLSAMMPKRETDGGTR